MTDEQFAILKMVASLENWKYVYPDEFDEVDQEALEAGRQAIEQAEKQPDLDAICQDLQEKTYAQAMRIAELEQAQKQEPVAMKFEIYKPTVPDPTRQDINNALLPWVYDQDRSSGFDASMWVIPVATLPPQRQPLTDEQIGDIAALFYAKWRGHEGFARAIEAAHGITASEAEDSAKGEA